MKRTMHHGPKMPFGLMVGEGTLIKAQSLENSPPPSWKRTPKTRGPYCIPPHWWHGQNNYEVMSLHWKIA